MKDPKAASRKKDHIDLAFQSQVDDMELDRRFYYEPMLHGHPGDLKPFEFLGRELRTPIWVSSMTGGTEMARKINRNLAEACAEFGMGMGLGSCRALLDSDEHLEDFNVRPLIGEDLPLFANLGIAQVEALVQNGQTRKISNLVDKLSADGLFVHVNPLQEWLQPEGDLIREAPVVTIAALIDKEPDLKIAVKEVGQGMGPESLEALVKMPLAAIEFAAHGGTNFSKLELLRNGAKAREEFLDVSRLGHSAAEMTALVNAVLDRLPADEVGCDQFIISGGVRNFLDGYYLTSKLNADAVYGQASALLKHAAESYEELHRYLDLQVRGFAMASAFLRLRH